MVLATLHLSTVSSVLECRQNELTLWQHFWAEKCNTRCLDIWYQGKVAFYCVHTSSRKTSDKLLPATYAHILLWTYQSLWSSCFCFMMCSSKVVSTLASWSFLHKEKEYTGKRRKKRSKGKSRVGKKPSKILWLKKRLPNSYLKLGRLIPQWRFDRLYCIKFSHILSQKRSLTGGGGGCL